MIATLARTAATVARATASTCVLVWPATQGIVVKQVSERNQ